MIAFFPSRAVALTIGSFSIHWYGLLYLCGFFLAWVLIPRLQKFRKLSVTRDEWGTILSAAVVGVIVGGRLGFVFFYEPVYFLSHPWEILMVWKGGMASHGGFIGVTVALLWTLRRRSWTEIWKIADIIVVPIAIGLALGRVGNFINQELYGIVTDLPWGITVPGEQGLRHPTQLYAVAKDLLIAVVCFVHLFRTRDRMQPGQTFALFLLLYGVLRFLIEFLREQHGEVWELGGLSLSQGQMLTLPVILIGFVMWIRKRNLNR